MPVRLRPAGRRAAALFLAAVLAAPFEPPCAVAAGAAADVPQRPAEPAAAADRAEVDAFRLTPDVLARMTAMARQARSMHVLEQDKGDGAVDAGAGPVTLAALARQVDADPRVHALLAAHGFTARGYLVASMALGQAAMASRIAGLKGGDRLLAREHVDPANVAFYDAHRAEIQALFAPDRDEPVAAPAGDPQGPPSGDIAGLDPALRHDCAFGGLGLLPLVALDSPASGAVDPAARRRIADRVAAAGSSLEAPRLKRDYADIAAELRARADEPQARSARLDAAGSDVHAWLDAHCGRPGG